MSNHIYKTIADNLLLPTAGCLLIYLALSLYLIHTKMEFMLESLKNCRTIKQHKFLKKSGPWGKMVLLGTITGLMITPNIYLRNGDADLMDLKDFPRALRIKLIILQWFGTTILLIIFLSVVLKKIEVI